MAALLLFLLLALGCALVRTAALKDTGAGLPVLVVVVVELVAVPATTAANGDWDRGGGICESRLFDEWLLSFTLFLLIANSIN